MFGTLAVGWLATIQVVDLEDATRTAFETAVLLWIPNLMAGFTIAWMFGRMPAVRFAVPLILIISGLHGGIQLGLTFWNPILSTFIAASVGLVAFYPLSRWQRYANPAEGIEERKIMRDSTDDTEDEPAPDKEEDDAKPIMSLPMSAIPYVVLTVVSVLALVIPPVEEALEQVEVGFAFPAVETGYEITQDDEEPYSPFAVLTHPGTFLLIAAIAAWLVYRAKGYYERWTERTGESGIWSGLVGDAIPASAAIVGFLVMSQVMAHAGQTETLALGIAEVAPAIVFAFFANWIGVLGAFMTSSNTASNVLFAPLQQTVAGAEGLSEASIIAAQSTGGAIGNTIAPANVVLGTGTAGIVGQEGQVLRKTLPWAAVAAILTGIATILFTGVGL